MPERRQDNPLWFVKFRDLAGRLPAIHVHCRECERRGRYPLYRVMARRGPNGDVRVWLNELVRSCKRCGGSMRWLYRRERTILYEPTDYLIEGWPRHRG